MASGAPAGSTYMWTGPNGYTSTEQNPVINPVALNNAGDYTAKITTPQGCESNFATAENPGHRVVVTHRYGIELVIMTSCAGDRDCHESLGAGVDLFVGDICEKLLPTHGIEAGRANGEISGSDQ